MIGKRGIITDGIWTGTASDRELAKLIDGKNKVDMVDTTKTGCYFQIKYRDNYLGVLDQVNFYINKLKNKSDFEGNL